MTSRYPVMDPIDELTFGYRTAQVVFTASRLGIFVQLGRDTLSLETLAQRARVTPRGLRILCDALVSLALLRKTEAGYQNTETALEYLLPDSPKSKTAILYHNATLYETWGRLYDVVKEGKPVDRSQIADDLQGSEATFAAAMADVARFSARDTVRLLDLSSCQSLLDAGGGPGLYAIEFARQNPHLQAVIMDNEATLAVARENIHHAGLEGQVRTRPGDVLRDPLGGPYTMIFASNLIHAFSDDENQNFVRRCAEALEPGGRLCLKDFYLEDDRTAPMANTLFAVNMLVNTEGGDCYTFAEAHEWLAQAGLTPEEPVRQTPISSLVIGRK